MLLSIYSQISLIGFAALGLVYCVFGYKYARFLLPVCSVLIIEIAMYLFVPESMIGDDLYVALFYGASAIVIYIVLFFILRLSGFITGIMGAALFLVYVVYTFGLEHTPYVVPAFLALCLIAGLLCAAYERVGVITASSLLGGSLASGVVLFLIFSGGANLGADESLLNTVYSIVRSNAYLFLIAAAVISALGIFIQMRFTGFSQVLNKRAVIRYEKRKPKKKLVKAKTGK